MMKRITQCLHNQCFCFFTLEILHHSALSANFTQRQAVVKLSRKQHKKVLTIFICDNTD
jgi:hypothetical protein